MDRSEAISGFVARQFVGEVYGTLQGCDHRNSLESLSGKGKNNDRNIDSVVMKKNIHLQSGFSLS